MGKASRDAMGFHVMGEEVPNTSKKFHVPMLHGPRIPSGTAFVPTMTIGRQNHTKPLRSKEIFLLHGVGSKRMVSMMSRGC
jgi:hypothetical protein